MKIMICNIKLVFQYSTQLCFLQCQLFYLQKVFWIATNQHILIDHSQIPTDVKTRHNSGNLQTLTCGVCKSTSTGVSLLAPAGVGILRAGVSWGRSVAGFTTVTSLTGSRSGAGIGGSFSEKSWNMKIHVH